MNGTPDDAVNWWPADLPACKVLIRNVYPIRENETRDYTVARLRFTLTTYRAAYGRAVSEINRRHLLLSEYQVIGALCELL